MLHASKIQQDHPCIFSPCFCFALAPHVEGASHHTSATDASAHCRCTRGRMTCASQSNSGSSLQSPWILANEGPRSIYNLAAAPLCSNTPALLGQTTSGRERGKALLLAQPDHERKMICTSKESGGHFRQRGALPAFLLGNLSILSKVAAYFGLQWGGGHIHHRLYLQIDYSMYSTQMFGVTLAILSR